MSNNQYTMSDGQLDIIIKQNQETNKNLETLLVSEKKLQDKSHEKQEEIAKATKDLTEAIKTAPKPPKPIIKVNPPVVKVNPPEVKIEAPIVNVDAPIIPKQKAPIVNIDLDHTNELISQLTEEVKKKEEEESELEISRAIVEELKDGGGDIVTKLAELEGDERLSLDDLKDVPNFQALASRSTPVKSEGNLVANDIQSLNFTSNNVAVTDDGHGNIEVDISQATGDITAVGDVTGGAAFTGTQGTSLTFFNAGGNATFNYDGVNLISSVDLTVPDEVYGIGWDGSLEVPTKNAVYDEMETKQDDLVYDAQLRAFIVDD